MIADEEMIRTETNEALAKQLEATGNYRVLRRLAPHPIVLRPASGAKIGIVIDVETTGLDTARDEVIELAMVKFAYSADDQILGVIDVFQSFRQPSRPIPPAIVELTRITDAMVEGCAIEAEAVVHFADEANIIIAHSASFDRKFAERSWPVFAQKPWACTATEVDWKGYGFGGAKLEQLLSRFGLFYNAHRAIDDCNALVSLLGQLVPAASAPVLTVLLDRARRKTIRLWAQHSPFELKDVLKRRNYRWSDGADGRPKSWYIDVEEDNLESELLFLRTEIYQREIDIDRQEFTALDRFADRR